MFRQMRRFKQEQDKETCINILKTEKRGVLSLSGDDDYPYGIPINFFYDEENNKIIFHGAGEGHKIDAIKRNNKVSFCTWNKGEQVEGQWYYKVISVIVFGKIKIIEDGDYKVSILRKLGQKYYPNKEDVEIEINKDLHRVTLLELEIEYMTGKIVEER